LITNSASEFLEFARAHEGDVIDKVASGGPFERTYPQLVRYTAKLTRRDLAYIGRLRNCPTTFQANVPKRFEVRATVVGSEVFAAEIHSQASRQASQDWRRFDLMNTPHKPHRLPPELARRCVALVHELGLSYGAIDLIVRPDGRYIFLEINPNGQYLWVEELTGLPISAAIADFLTTAARKPYPCRDGGPSLTAVS
jgi:hypothetical protein